MKKRKTIFLSADVCDAGADGSRRSPVATLENAVAISRQHGGNCRIEVGPGAYLDTNVLLTAEDSGLEIAAAPEARPAFYGGIRLEGWRREHKNSPFWVADLPKHLQGRSEYRVLIVNNRFAPRARFPSEGVIPHASRFPVEWMSSTKGGWARKPTQKELTTLKLVSGSLPETMSERNAELTVYHMWDESLVDIKRWDRNRGIITFSMPAQHPPGAFCEMCEQSHNFVVWNTREGMTDPGQWFHDREKERIVYRPLKGERISEAKAFIPAHGTVLRLAGSENAPVRDVIIKGVTFGLTTTPMIVGNFGALRFDGAVEGEYAHGLTLDGVTFRWAGGHGVRVQNSDGVRFVNCDAHDLGAGGAVFSGAKGSVIQSLVCRNGRVYASAAALRIIGPGWSVVHNTIHHNTYSAIVAKGENLRIENNRIHHIMEELLDGAGIYIFAAKSCVMRGNYVYDVRDTQVHAYYLDEQSEDSLVEGNVAEEVFWPIHNHMARNCVVRGNVCVNTGDMHISFVRCDRFTLQRNVFLCGGELIFDSSCTGIGELRNNLCFSKKGRYRWTFDDILPSLERNSIPVPLLPAHFGSMAGESGCECHGGKVTYTDKKLARRFRLPAPDVSRAGCSRGLIQPVSGEKSYEKQKRVGD